MILFLTLKWNESFTLLDQMTVQSSESNGSCEYFNVCIIYFTYWQHRHTIKFNTLRVNSRHYYWNYQRQFHGDFTNTLTDSMTAISRCFIYQKYSHLTQHETKYYCWVYDNTILFAQTPSYKWCFRAETHDLQNLIVWWQHWLYSTGLDDFQLRWLYLLQN